MSKAARRADPHVFEPPAHPVQSPAVLDRVRGELARALLPVTAMVLDISVSIGLPRLKSALATLEARGEVTLNKRGDAVFSILFDNQPETSAPESAA